VDWPFVVLLDVSIVEDSVVKLQKFAGCVFVGLGGGRKQQSQWARVGCLVTQAVKEVIDLHA
jgi:hypothetical protein